MSQRRRSLEDVRQQKSYDQLRDSLLNDSYKDRLDKPLAFWARKNDRGLPMALLDRSLRELLNVDFDILAQTPGVGQKKTGTLIQLLRRAADEPPMDATMEMGPSTAVPPATNGEAYVFDSGEVSDSQWERWCRKLRESELADEALGRLAPCLQDLPTVIWNAPLAEYSGYRLSELRRLPNHGEKRVRAIVEVFHSVDQLIGPANDRHHMQVRLVPRLVAGLEEWLSDRGGRRDLPTAGEVRRRLANPLIDQAEHDLGATIARLARRRLGVSDSPVSILKLAESQGITRARVYQLLDQCADMMTVRWPEGRQRLGWLAEHFAARDGYKPHSEAMRLFQATCQLFFPPFKDD